MYEELKELKELLDMGAITQEEFDAKKTELLSVAFSEKDLTNPAAPLQPPIHLRSRNLKWQHRR